MYQINEDLRVSIEKNLPSAVGDVLKERLEQAEKDANDIKVLRTRSEGQAREIQQQNARIDALEAKLRKHEDLDKRASAVAEAERDLKVRQLEQQLAAEQRISAALNGALTGLVRNTEFRSSFYESVTGRSHVVPGSAGYSGCIQQAPGTETTSRSASQEAS